jgi:hypothetical protein
MASVGTGTIRHGPTDFGFNVNRSGRTIINQRIGHSINGTAQHYPTSGPLHPNTDRDLIKMVQVVILDRLICKEGAKCDDNENKVIMK